jgi:hypothetical protein
MPPEGPKLGRKELGNMKITYERRGELIALEQGGTAPLIADTEANNNVQIGTGETTAELEIARHENDLQELREKTNKLASEQDNFANAGCDFGVILACCGLIELTQWQWKFGATALIFGLILLCAYQFTGKRRPELEALREQVRQLENLIAEKKLISNLTDRRETIVKQEVHGLQSM